MALWVPVAFAQKKIPVIGFLWNDAINPSPYATVLLAALREKGYESGRNIRIDDRVALEGYGPMDRNAEALAASRVDVIVAYGRTATQAATRATKEIPVVTVIGSDPVATGLAASLSRPGGNVTGVYTLGSDLIAKRVELLRELVPGIKQFGVLLASGAVGYSANRQNFEGLARSQGMAVQFGAVGTPAEIDAAVAGLARSKVRGLVVLGSTMLAARAAQVVAAAEKHRLPAVYSVDRFADAGGLLVIGPAMHKAFARAASHVVRILEGARAADLPIEQMNVVELTVNLKAARAMGIKMPQSILVRADRIIE